MIKEGEVDNTNFHPPLFFLQIFGEKSKITLYLMNRKALYRYNLLKKYNYLYNEK